MQKIKKFGIIYKNIIIKSRKGENNEQNIRN